MEWREVGIMKVFHQKSGQYLEVPEDLEERTRAMKAYDAQFYPSENLPPQPQNLPTQQPSAQKNNNSMAPYLEYMNNPPIGSNIATGLMSLMAKTPEQRELIQNIPQAFTGKQPTFQSELGNTIGQYLPSMGGGELVLPARLAAAAATGAAMKPEDRLKGAEEGTAMGLGGEVLGKIPGMAANSLTRIFPTKTAQSIANYIGGGKSLEEHAKDFTGRIKNAYKDVSKDMTQKYNELFKTNNLGETKVFEKPDPMIRISNDLGDYASQDKDIFKELPKDLRQAHEETMKDPTLGNYHSLQSKYGYEERTLSRDYKRTSDPEVKKQLDFVKEQRDMIQKDMHEKMGKDVSTEYKAIGSEYADKLGHWYSDPTLRKIIFGELENPTKADFKKIFKNADSDTKKLLSQLDPEVEKDVLFQAIGKQPGNYDKNTFPKRIDALNESGFEHYINKKPIHKQAQLMKGAGTKREIALEIAKLLGIAGAGGYGVGAGIAKYMPKALGGNNSENEE